MDVSSTIPAGEAFVTSFSDMTRLMVGQSKALARKVSLAQLLDSGDHDGDSSNPNNGSTSNDTSNSIDNKENYRSDNSSSSNGAATNATTRNTATINTNTNTDTKHSGLSEHTDSNTTTTNNGAAVVVGTNKARAKVLQDLRSLDAIVLDLERRAASMRDAIDHQRRGNKAFRELSEATRRQTAQLAAACASLPEYLPHDGPTAATAVAVASTSRAGTDAERREPPSSAAATAAVSAVVGSAVSELGARTTVGGAAAAAAGHSDGHAFRVTASALPVVPVLELVTVGELEGVPRSTRGRLTIAHINAAVTEIQKAMERRHAFISKPRNKMSEKQRRLLEQLQQQAVPGHVGGPFMTEADLRALPAFKKGEMTTKALIATLRNLKRLKGVRGAGIMTYVLERG